MSGKRDRDNEQNEKRQRKQAAREEALAAKAELAAAKRMRARAGRESEARARLKRAEEIKDSVQRLEFFDSAADYTTFLGVDTPEGSYILDTAGGSISRRLFAEYTYAANLIPGVTEFLAGLGRPVRRDSTILDIGANIGTVSIGAIVAYGFGRAIAAEAHEPCRRLLRINALLNDLEERVQIIGALSDVDGPGLSSGGPEAGGNARVLPANPRGGRAAIQLTRLDTLVERGEVSVDDVGLVWIDVQGHEPMVLDGARKLLERGVPVVAEFSPNLLETHPDGLERMITIVGEQFESLVDLRGGVSRASEVQPADAIEGIAEELGERFTNLLLLPA